MAEPLVVSLVQPDLKWHDPAANRQHLERLFDPLCGATDLIVLPEMFTLGFTDFPEIPEKNSPTISWLELQAKRLNCAITGSLAVKKNSGEYVNRLFFVMPSGEALHYDKVHLFRMDDEHLRYQPGSQRKVINYRGWRLLLTICYDIRFPVFCRNQEDYDALICVANWPSSRRHHWRSLLVARAIENQAYVLGVNRVGVDGKSLHYSGDSMLVDFNGEMLIDGPDKPWVKSCELNFSAMLKHRGQFPVWKDRDHFTLK